MLGPYDTKFNELNGLYEATKSNLLAVQGEYGNILKQHSSISQGLETEAEGYKSLRNEFAQFQEKAVSNLHGLRSTVIASNQLYFYMQGIKAAGDESAAKLQSSYQDAARLLDSVIHDIKPTDEYVLSWAYSVYGVVLYLDNQYAEAMDAFKKAVANSQNNDSAWFNGACCACILADKAEQEGQSKDAVAALENEAISFLRQALTKAPWRRTEAKQEGDMTRLQNNPQFKALTS